MKSRTSPVIATLAGTFLLTSLGFVGAAPAQAAVPVGQVCADATLISSTSHWNQPLSGLIPVGDGTYTLPGIAENAATSAVTACTAATAWTSESSVQDGYFSVTTNPELLFESDLTNVISLDMIGTPAGGGWVVKALDTVSGTSLTATEGNTNFWYDGTPEQLPTSGENTVHYEFTATDEQAANIRAGHLAIFLGAFGTTAPGFDQVYFSLSQYAPFSGDDSGTTEPASLASTGSETWPIAATGLLALFTGLAIHIGLAARRRQTTSH
jgi:hypothetical protein